ncbi:MAG TPA: NAD-dependent epimerase/dehydratase family protein, partial [Balneolaceae bacterium]|nr:NAD-dependent epimerase/dehydratase family protein [Balneolaceae bacterium]
DLTHKKELFKAVEGSEIVYLTLGFEKYSAKVWRRKWPVLMKRTIEACKKYGSKLVFFDNIYMYDCAAIDNMTEQTVINPCSRKGKIRAEVAKMVTDEFQQNELNAVIARSADFYGPQAGNSILGQTVIQRLEKDKKALWMADTKKVHNFTFTLDAAKATALLGNTPDAYNQVWHLPTDHTKLTGSEWIELIAKELDKKPAYRTLPIWLMKAAGIFVPMMRELKEMAYQYDRNYFFNSAKFEEAFDVSPTTPIAGIRQVLR